MSILVALNRLFTLYVCTWACGHVWRTQQVYLIIFYFRVSSSLPIFLRVSLRSFACMGTRGLACGPYRLNTNIC